MNFDGWSEKEIKAWFDTRKVPARLKKAVRKPAARARKRPATKKAAKKAARRTAPAPAARQKAPAKKAKKRSDCSKAPTRGSSRSGMTSRRKGKVCGVTRGPGWKKRSLEFQGRSWKNGKIPTQWPRPLRVQAAPFAHGRSEPVKFSLAQSVRLESDWKKIPPGKKPYRRIFNPRVNEIPVESRKERVPIWTPAYEAAVEKKKAKISEGGDRQAVTKFVEKQEKSGAWPMATLKGYGDPDLRWFLAGPQAGKILVMFSGGKDSLALLLYVLEVCLSMGLDPRDHVEAWHQCVDGRPEHLGGKTSRSTGAKVDYKKANWDWPVTEDYCQAVCDCLEIPLFFGWRVGGLQGTVLRGEKSAAPRAPAEFELPTPHGRRIGSSGGSGGKNVRMSYPAPGANLKSRWCSSEVKIDVAEAQLAARSELRGKRVLYCSGERADESANRETYAEREFYGSLVLDESPPGLRQLHGSHKRHVEKWRPLLDWWELDVWAIIRRWGIVPHPGYEFFSRLSCMTCIFGNAEQWATIKKIDSLRFDQFSATERALKQRKEKDGAKAKTRLDTIKKGTPLPVFVKGAEARPGTQRARVLAMATEYKGEVRVPVSRWRLPAGAFGEDSGPS